MPELPDILLYLDALERLLKGCVLTGVQVRSPSVLKTYQPDLSDCVGHELLQFHRSGKRVIWEFANGQFVVIHLMIAGRFHWKKKKTLPKGKNDLAAFHFGHGTMMLTEASPKKRAGIWCFQSFEETSKLDRGGLDVLSSSDAEIIETLMIGNNTLKRALTDPSRFDGIGNAYSDEILHAAKLSPLRKTQQLSDEELTRLARAMKRTLLEWIEALKAENGERFPERVTAFRPQMAVHGKFDEPCPVCSSPVQRIRYTDRECNYCPGCQTEGRILADRSLSRLLKDDWPKTIEDLEG